MDWFAWILRFWGFCELSDGGYSQSVRSVNPRPTFDVGIQLAFTPGLISCENAGNRVHEEFA